MAKAAASDSGNGTTPATSRQKSCNACVRGKRRCDKLYPVCSRCHERKVPCIYAGKRPYSEAFPPEWEDASVSAAAVSPLDAIDWGHLTDPLPDPYLDVLLGQAATMLEPGASIDGSGTSIQEATGDSVDMNMRTTAPQGGMSAEEAEFQLQPFNGGNKLELDTFDWSQIPALCVHFEPWQVYIPNTQQHYLVETFKRFPGVFARNGATSWMHHALYADHTEPPLERCLAVSALYEARTQTNQAAVMRVLGTAPEELKQQSCGRAGAAGMTPRVRLARVQALFLYQIMRLFDADVSLRARAEKDMTLLHSWVDDLCNVRENLAPPDRGDGAGRLREQPPLSWEWWVFAESVRRTVIIIYMFLGMWDVMSHEGRENAFAAWKYVHRWTLSRHLWEAPSSFEFDCAWREKPAYSIGNIDMSAFVKTGTGDDLDDFSKLFLVVYMGLDVTKKWCADTGHPF